ncbi:DUF4235 domain-containing protein [Arcanobacterium hippocoleae]
MNLLWKLVSIGVSAGAGFAAQKGVEVFWEKVLQNQKPKGDESDEELPALQIAAFAAVTAGVNSVVTALIDRKLKAKYRKEKK